MLEAELPRGSGAGAEGLGWPLGWPRCLPRGGSQAARLLLGQCRASGLLAHLPMSPHLLSPL